jgi:hypothetical protein
MKTALILAAITLGATAARADVVFSGASCQPYNSGSAPNLTHGYGQIYNNTSTFQDVECPMTAHDLQTFFVFNIYVEIYQGSSTQLSNCYVEATSATGAGALSWVSTVPSTGYHTLSFYLPLGSTAETWMGYGLNCELGGGSSVIGWYYN